MHAGTALDLTWCCSCAGWPDPPLVVVLAMMLLRARGDSGMAMLP